MIKHTFPNIALVGLLVFQGYVSVNTGLSHSSHFFGRLDLVQKCHGMHTKVSFLYSLVLIEQLACLDDWPVLKRVKCIIVGAEELSAVHF